MMYNEFCVVKINALSGVNPEHLQYFELLGKVMAKSIFDGVQLDVHFR